jgi:putative ABC transport system substrate-binding protein
MKRREATIALAVLAGASFAIGAQQARKMHRIGFLGVTSTSDYAPYLDAFRQGLRELGYEEGRNIVIDYRWADGRDERLPELAAQLVTLDPDVLVSHAIGVAAVQKASSTIPIVMGVSSDPVGSGWISSLAKPGGNTTGVTNQLTDLSAKRLELLKEAVPPLKRVALLSNFAFPANQKGLEQTSLTGRKLGIHVQSFAVTAQPAELETVFAAILREQPDGIIVQPDPITSRHSARIAAFATKNRLPAMGAGREFVDKGGLASYGGNFAEGWRLAARYVDKILKGARPADLPVEQPATFELVINLKAAKAIGLAIPQSLLLRANEVIQ